METTRTTGVREIQTTRKDYEAYVECIFRTDYSIELDQISDEDDDYFRVSSIPSFERYCQIINKKMNSDKASQTYIVVYENENGEVVAIAELEAEGRKLRIQELVVDRKFQLSGYGKLFFEELEHTAKQNGYKEITLKCHFEGAKMFWLKMGFADRGIFVKTL